MPTKEAVERKKEREQIFNEIYQQALGGASPLKAEYLAKLKARYEELSKRKGGENDGP